MLCTHVSPKNLQNIKSPFDKLDLKLNSNTFGKNKRCIKRKIHRYTPKIAPNRFVLM